MNAWFTPDLMAILGLLAGVLCVLGLHGLSHPRTAVRGNRLAMAGMALAVIATFAHPSVQHLAAIVAALVVGAAIGIPLARRVSLVSLPQLVAAFHSFIGLAAALVAVGMYARSVAFGTLDAKGATELALGAAIGLITFSGSILAALKLQGVVGGQPWGWVGRHWLNLALALGILLCTVWFVATFSVWPLVLIVVLATVFGVTLVAPIGGADMPVVVSMLNSYSGWAAAATGFLLEQPLLVLVGALVGVSGAMLSAVMCKAMNRSFLSVIAGGFGAQTSAAGQGAAATQGTVALAGTADAAYLLQQAEHVVIVPGYGMAVAQAQHAVKALYAALTAQGVAVHFAIHPVAGRMPGHMNVLLAEADIPYDAVWELEEAAPRMAETDALLVLGANDVVNPAAETDRTSPIFGMPVLPVWQAKQVYVVKRSQRPGYAGVENPLFVMPNCALVLGDAKAVVEALVAGVKDHA